MSSFFRLERKQTISPNAYPIRKFLLRSYSFGVETINKFIHPRSSIEDHTRFQIKMGKEYTRFQTRKDKRPYTFGRYTSIWLIKGSPLLLGGIHPADKLGQPMGYQLGYLSFTAFCCCRNAGKHFVCYTINSVLTTLVSVKIGYILLVLFSLFLSLCCSFCKKRTWKISSLPDLIFSVKYAPFCILFWFL